MTVSNRAKFHHFPEKDTKVIDGGRYPPPQAGSVLKRPGEIGLRTLCYVILSVIRVIF